MVKSAGAIQLGIDIGGTSIKGALLDGEREVWVGRSGEYARPRREELVEAMGGMMERAREVSRGVSPRSIGVCAPGLRDASGVIVRAVNVPGLEGVKVSEMVEEVGRGVYGTDVAKRQVGGTGDVGDTGDVGGMVREFTDAYAAAVDYWRVRRGAGRMLALSMGTGIGACVLDAGAGGEPVALIVSGGGPGHLGQMDVGEFEGEVASGKKASRDEASRHGGGRTLEGYMGLPALRARFGEGLAGVIAKGEMRVDGAPVGALVRALRIAHAIYVPRRVVLLGGVGIRMGALVAGIRGAVSEGLTPLAKEGWTLEVGESDFHAARGAAWMAGRASA